MLRQPDHARRIDQDFVVAIARVGVEPLSLFVRAWIEFDQAVRYATVDKPDIPFGIEPWVLPITSDAIARPWLGVHPFVRAVDGEIVLDIHRLTERFLVDGCFLLDGDPPPRTVWAEVLDDILEQRITILTPKTERRRSKGKQPLTVASWVLFTKRTPDHVVDPRHPLTLSPRSCRKEVFAVADHADLLGHFLAAPRRIDLIVAGVLKVSRTPTFHRRSTGRDDELWRITRERTHREIHLGRIPRGDRHSLSIRLKMLRTNAHLVVAWKESNCTVAPLIRVDHVDDAKIDIPDVHLRRCKRLRCGDRPGQLSRAGNLCSYTQGSQNRDTN